MDFEGVGWASYRVSVKGVSGVEEEMRWSSVWSVGVNLGEGGEGSVLGGRDCASASMRARAAAREDSEGSGSISGRCVG